MGVSRTHLEGKECIIFLMGDYDEIKDNDEDTKDDNQGYRPPCCFLKIKLIITFSFI